MSERGRARKGQLGASCPEGWHRGWQVEGIPPDAARIVQMAHNAAQTSAGRNKAWDEQAWLRNAKLQKIAPAFASQAAALDCVAVAEHAGWRRVQIAELKSEGRHGASRERAALF
jgi:hypothetical protein